MISELYERNRYLMAVVRVIDGDSLIATIDAGFRIHTTWAIRLLGVNAPELPTAAGKAAKAAVETWLSSSAQLVIQTRQDKTDKYGRMLGTITRAGDVLSLNDWLVHAGHAVAYDGGKR